MPQILSLLEEYCNAGEEEEKVEVEMEEKGNHFTPEIIPDAATRFKDPPGTLESLFVNWSGEWPWL